MKGMAKMFLKMGICTAWAGALLMAGAVIGAASGVAVSAAPGAVALAAETDETAIDAESFPDEYFREYVQKYVDGNQDGVLQRDEAEAVTELTLDKFMDSDDLDGTDEDEPAEIHYYTKDEFVFDCKGLELFENLSDLSLVLNGGLTKNGKDYPVQVSHISSLYKLKKLEDLHIYDMDLKNFDCAKLTGLKKLSLSGFSSMESLSFGNSKVLTKIWLYDMPSLDVLDVSSLENLRSLSLGSADVEKIVFGKKNRSVRSLMLDSGDSSALCKRMKKLNLEKLAELKELYITNYKNLKFPDLSHNKKLELIFMENCPQVTKIAPLKNKKLTQVDIWNCRNLETLDLSKNDKLNWLRLDGMKVKTLRLSAKNKLKFFRYANAGLKKFNVKNINTKTMKDLQVYGNKFKKIDLSKYKNLKDVTVDEGVRVIGWKPKEGGGIYRDAN